MARTELRGNGVKHEALVKGIVLTVSAGIFFAGLGCFAWAADFAKDAQGQLGEPVPYSSSVSEMEELVDSGGQLDSSVLDAEDAGDDGSTTSGDASGTDSGSKKSSKSGNSKKQSKTKKTHVVHHTAYVRTPVYKTVSHPAHVERTVTTGGKTIKVWAACPVCGMRHTSSFSEQVLDHYDETFCAACGGKHAEPYDETVKD